MKTLISILLFGFSITCLAEIKITDFTVFSKVNIDYSRSDFEGLVGAGEDISVKDFSFVSGLSHAGILAGNDFKQSRGAIFSTPMRIGKTVQLDHLKVNGNISATWVYLDQSTIAGQIRANYLNMTTGYMGYATSSHGGLKKISHQLAENNRLNLINDLTAISIDLDSLSDECLNLPSEEASITNGKLLLKGSKELNVFTVDGTLLTTVYEIVFSVPSSSTVVINISGKSVRLENLGIKVNLSNPKKIIWNIFEATNLNIHKAGSQEIFNERAVGIPGSVMAPFADTVFTEGLITGSLLVKDLDGNEESLNGGQVNYSPMETNLCRRVSRGKQ